VARLVSEQVVVVTGASSGIGRATALALGARGTSVTLAARNEPALREVASEVERSGGRALVVPTDVSIAAQVDTLAERTLAAFGRIDGWINNAGISCYALAEDTTVEDLERVLRVDLIGQVQGMLAALPVMRRQGSGTIINVASVLAERAFPYLAAYAAAKHALKGYTDTLRLELAHRAIPVTITLILPSAIDTPIFANARSRLGVKPLPIPPVYPPSVVADAILFALEHPRREIVVGGGGKALLLANRISPELVDKFMLQRGRMFRVQRSTTPDDRHDNFFAPSPLAAETAAAGRVRASSPYTQLLEFHPRRKRTLAVLALLGALALVRNAGRRRDDDG
jgi:NAD(P)-dependent dehydrogenase (short-subunit alcohol dehydrogenase family)